MAYVGNSPEKGNFRKADQITCSATATYNLLVGGVAVNPNQNQCIVSLNGVIQSSGNSYTIASSQITFASALTSSDVIDFILILGDTLDVGVPSDDTVDASKITANVITGQSALGATPADTDELLISDAGTLKRVDYSYLKSSVVNRPNVNPLIINGDMQIAQRGASVTGKTSSGYYTVDRMKNVMNNLGTWTIAQETLTSGNAFAAGFNKAYRIDCTTADASPAAGDTFFFTTYLEGQNVQCFKKGTANAETYTLSFWVKSNKTGTGQVNLVDNDNSRMCGASYTISSADTWEHKICTYAADTTGAFGNDNGRSLKMEWWLDSGSTYTSGTMPTAWEADSNADSNAAGTLSLADNTANDWAITGIQLEVGTYTSSTLPPFQFESYGANLTRCQRYFQMFGGSFYGAYSIMYIGSVWSTSQAYIPTPMPTTMRDKPSFTMGGALSDFTWQDGNTTGNPTGLAADQMHENVWVLSVVNSSATFTDGQAVRCYNNSTNGYMEIAAEL